MKLYLNPPSPYARKVVVLAHEVGLADRIEMRPVDPWEDPPALIEATPLARVPALVMDNGRTLVESATICDYLMERAGGPLPLGAPRFDILGRAALAHGMMDAAFVSVIEKRRPKQRQWPDWIDRQFRALTRALPTFAVPPAGRFDLGDITLACALAYLDFRVGDLAWRTMRPDLGLWLDGVSNRPSMLASRP